MSDVLDPVLEVVRLAVEVSDARRNYRKHGTLVERNEAIDACNRLEVAVGQLRQQFTT